SDERRLLLGRELQRDDIGVRVARIVAIRGCVASRLRAPIPAPVVELYDLLQRGLAAIVEERPAQSDIAQGWDLEAAVDGVSLARGDGGAADHGRRRGEDEGIDPAPSARYDLGLPGER